MRKKVMQNSKKGFSLPVAIGISAFLIIISASLLFIAINSTSTTSAHLNSRQAYLNVRSALEYAQSYYSNSVTDYSKYTKAEYMIMKDDTDGTTSDGAKFSDKLSDAQKAVTYVEANYIKGEGSSKSIFKLTAYSRYSDSFGNRAAVARLSVSFTVGSSAPNRITIATLPVKRGSLVTQDKINLNVKKPASMNNFDLTYYVWTYVDQPDANHHDVGQAYAFYDESSGHSGLTYTGEQKNKDGNYLDKNTFISRLNKTTRGKFNLNNGKQENNEVVPNAEWMTNSDDVRKLMKGPNGVLSDEGNDWYSGTYYIKSGRVPWFNIIFAQRGSVLAGSGGPSNIYNSQTNEMFHLWYLDPSDKNIYFEFQDNLKTEPSPAENYPYSSSGKQYFTKYYEGQSWDGIKGLDDTVLVYVNNPKSLVHFAIKGEDVNETKTKSFSGYTEPTLIWSNSDKSTVNTKEDSYLKPGDKKATSVKMTYEGCGWWVTNIATAKAFDLTINCTYKKGGNDDAVKTVNESITNITSDDPLNSKKREFWVVCTPGDQKNSLDVFESEEEACKALGIEKHSYVTVHAKVAESNNFDAKPKILYTDVKDDDGGLRQALYEILSEYVGIVEEDYTTESFAPFKQAIEAGWEAYNKNQATTDYDALIANIKDKAQKLKLVACEDFTEITRLLQAANSEVIEAEEARYDSDKELPIYDHLAYYSFKSSLENISAELNNDGITKVRVAALEETIRTKRTFLETFEIKDNNGKVIGYGGKINRDKLTRLINEYKVYYDDTEKYEEEAHNAFVKKYDAAVDARNEKETTQIDLNEAVDSLENALIELGKHLKSGANLDWNAFDTAVGEAAKRLKAESGYTIASMEALEKAYNKALKEKESITNQTVLDNKTKELQAAVDGFDYPIPEDCINELKSNNKFRVWAYTDKAPDGYSVRVNAYPIGSTTPTVFTLNSGLSVWNADYPSEERKDFENKIGFCYVDLDLSQFDRVAVDGISSDGHTSYASQVIKLVDITDGNLVFVVKENEVAVDKLVTLYALVPKNDDVKLKYDTKQIKRSAKDGKYIVARMVLGIDKFTVKGKSFNIQSRAYKKNYSSTLKINEPGEYIFKVITPTKPKVTIVTPDDIVPFCNVENENNQPDEPQIGGTLATGDLEYSDLVQYSDDVEVMDLAMTSGANSRIIYFTNSQNWGTVYAYFWGSGYSQAWPGSVVNNYAFKNEYNQFVYKIYIPNGAQNVIFSNGSNQNQSVDCHFTAGYQYWVTGSRNNQNKLNLGSAQYEKTGSYDAADYYIYITNNKDKGRKNNVYQDPNDDDWDNLHIYFFNDSGAVGASWPGYLIDDYVNNNEYQEPIYRIKPPKNATGFVLSSPGHKVTINGQEKQPHENQYQSVNVSINQNAKDRRYYFGTIRGDKNKLEVLYVGQTDHDDDNDNHNDNNNYNNYDNGRGKEGYEEPDLKTKKGEDNQKDIPLAYVGGAKVRITNKSYAETCKDITNQKRNSRNDVTITNSNKFGGSGATWDNPRGGNNNSDGRLGDSALSAYVDWYEVKLPISDTAKYTFALSGMSPKEKNIQTKTIKDAYGDVWIEQLDNYRGGKGHFQNINIYTFDPEYKDPEDKSKGTLPENLSVYFERPRGWGDPTITASGPFGSLTWTTNYTNQNDGNRFRIQHKDNLFYITNIPKNYPYITFKINGKKYEAAHKGGDMIKYVINLSDQGKSGWTEYVPLNERVRRQVNRLRNMYYGYAIYDKQNNDGTLASGAARLYSQGLVSYIQKYSLAQSPTTGGDTYYIINTAEINRASENDYTALKNTLDLYEALYDKIYYVRAYIKSPLKYGDIKNANGGSDYYYPNSSDQNRIQPHSGAGGMYYEYVSRTYKSKTYESIVALRNALAKAELVFLKGGTNIEIQNAIKALETEENRLEVKSEGSICCVLYDVQQKKAAGYHWKLIYKTSQNGDDIYYNNGSYINDFNPEKFPIVFLSHDTDNHIPDTNNFELYNVRFEEYAPGSSDPNVLKVKSVMQINSTWVYMDEQEESAQAWKPNSVSDYRQINVDEFSQDTANEKQKYTMKKDKDNSYQPMTLLFVTDTVVKRYNDTKYTIKAGAYYFDNEDTAPMSNGTIDLYSQAAENYFSNRANYGEFVNDGYDFYGNLIKGEFNASGSLNWYNKNDRVFSTGIHYRAGYGNMEAYEGNFNSPNTFGYYTSNGLYFRWSSDDDLVVKKEVRLASNEIRIASSGVIVGNRSDSHFYLGSYTERDSIIVNFLTDVFVKYIDKNGRTQEFSIREGKYVIKRDPNSSNIYTGFNYIADLFDKDYWKKMEYITYIGRASYDDDKGIGQGGGKLQNGIYE